MPQSGLISGRSMDHSSLEEWASSLEVSPVSRSQLQESNWELLMNAISGRKRGELSGKWDPNGSCWRMSQLSLLEMDETGQHMGAPWLDNLPAWGSIQNSELYRLPMPEPPISGNGSGFSHIPTPTPSDVFIGNLNSQQTRDGSMHSVNLPKFTAMWPTPATMDYIERTGMRPSREATGRTTGYLSEEIIKWPTPTGDDANNVTRDSGGFQSLTRSIKSFPTPMARDYKGHTITRNHPDGFKADFPSEVERLERETWPTPNTSDAKGANMKDGHDLKKQYLRGVVVAQQWPTPTVAEANKISNRANYGQIGLSNHPAIRGAPDRDPMAKSRQGDGTSTWATPTSNNAKTNGTAGQQARHGPCLDVQVGGSLNPDWVEWLMGVPVGWTRLEPLPEEAFAQWVTQMIDGSWWEDEKDLPRVIPSEKGRVDRLKALGNGIVPRTIPTFLYYTESNR